MLSAPEAVTVVCLPRKLPRFDPKVDSTPKLLSGWEEHFLAVYTRSWTRRANRSLARRADTE